MSVKAPINLLYANTAARHRTSSALARTRKVRDRVPEGTRKIGIFDISARAGLLLDVLDFISRRQRTFTFYPVEAPVPMGVGLINEKQINEFRDEYPDDKEVDDLALNVMVEEFAPLLEATRRGVNVDMIAGLFGPMLAFYEDDLSLHWNYFSVPVEDNIAISVFHLREYALEARRPFEAAVAIVTLAQIWAKLYHIDYHPESRGCPFDFCENRDDLVSVIRNAELCEESLRAIPRSDREDVQRCLSAIREYSR